MKSKPTEHLLNRLNKVRNESDLQNYINYSRKKVESLMLSDYILEVAKDKDLKKSEIIRNAGIYRTYGYEILSGKKLPSRDKLLQICLGNNFSLEETNRCLTIAKLGILYAKDPRDSIIIFAINNNLDLITSNIILDDHALHILD